MKTFNQIIGYNKEKWAIKYLKLKNFKILACNYRYKKAEIDIISKSQGFLVFVEVRARSSISFGYPESTVSRQKQKLYFLAAEYYLDKNDWKGPIRFDIISFFRNRSTWQINHFEDAFF